MSSCWEQRLMSTLSNKPDYLVAIQACYPDSGCYKEVRKRFSRETVFNLPCFVFSELVFGLRCSVRWFSVSMERKTSLPFWSSFILKEISLNCLSPTVSYSTSEIPAWSIFAQHDRKKGVHIRRYKSWTQHELSNWV